jgi:predicted metal-dependent hydrolase
MRVTDDAVRLAVISRFGWVRRKQAAFREQERQSRREFVAGESHYVQGRRYRLEVVEHDGPGSVELRKSRTLRLRVRSGSELARREAILDAWYRARLQSQIEDLVAQWQPIIKVCVADWAVRRMRTRWGTCNIDRRRICVNLELAKKSPACLEYVVVHEMVHLLARKHDAHFKTHMDRLMPRWQLRRDELNRSPLAHETWRY